MQEVQNLVRKLTEEGKEVVVVPLWEDPLKDREIKEEVKWTKFKKCNSISDAVLKQQQTDSIWINSIYQVHVTYEGPKLSYNDLKKGKCSSGVMHLSFKTHGREPRHDWREMQRIKNELCGTACEAIEIYPSKDRTVDTCNQYHLWVFPPLVKD